MAPKKSLRKTITESVSTPQGIVSTPTPSGEEGEEDVSTQNPSGQDFVSTPTEGDVSTPKEGNAPTNIPYANDRAAYTFDLIPPGLMALPQWGVFRREWKNGENKPQNVPYDAKTGLNLSSTDPATWCDFATARFAYERGTRGQWDGINFTVHENNGLVALDLDNCVDENGNPTPEAQEIMRLWDSYLEYSPSRRGIRGFALGVLPEGRRVVSRNGSKYEIYDRAKPLTVTGWHIAGTPTTIEDRSAAIAQIHARFFTPAKRQRTNRLAARADDLEPLPDEEVIALLKRAKNSDRILALMNNDLSAYGDDESAADFAIINFIAFYTGPAREQIDRIAQSEFPVCRRKKWNKRYSDGSTYGSLTITNVLEDRTEFYTRPRQQEFLTDEEDKTMSGENVATPQEELEDATQGSSAQPKRQPNQEDATYELILTPYSEIKEQPLEWLWYPYIPLGAVTTVEGNMGEGKSWFTLALAAAVSTGRFPFTKETQTPANVLHLNVEDLPEQTISPRLRILNADKDRVIHIKGTTRTTADGPAVLDFTLSHIPALEQSIRAKNARLVILDPLQAYLPSGKSMNKSEDMRPLFSRLARLARETNCAIIVVRHFGKSLTSNNLHKALGSVDIAASVRSTIFIGVDRDWKKPADSDLWQRHVVAHAKHNLAPKGKSLLFDLQEDSFTWSGKTQITADELVNQGLPGDEASQRKNARRFLEDRLFEGEDLASEIIKNADKIGVSRATLYRAADELKVIKVPKKAPSGRFISSMWSLPKPESEPEAKEKG